MKIINLAKKNYKIREFEVEVQDFKVQGLSNSYDKLVGQFESKGLIALYSKELGVTDIFRVF
jgi:hypothetical protein